MKYLLIFLVKFYWFIYPEHKRRNCIFSISCSRYVFNVTKEKGLLNGLKALNQRFKTCRPNHQIFYLDSENIVIIKLSDGSILQENEIASNIISNYKKIN